MGSYDDITPEELRTRLTRVARLILTLEERGTLLERGPELLKLLGELRRMLFAYEVRHTGRLLPDEPVEGMASDGDEPQAEIAESLRIVEEALEAERRLQDELRDRFFPNDDD